jgi:hypothetical protein
MTMPVDHGRANARPLLAPSAPLWSIGLLASIEAAAGVADVLVTTAEALPAAGRVRTERIQGELCVRVGDLIAAALEPAGPPVLAPLLRRLEDHRRRRATAALLLFDEGNGASEDT